MKSNLLNASLFVIRAMDAVNFWCLLQLFRAEHIFQEEYNNHGIDLLKTFYGSGDRDARNDAQ